jgi:hypothetical protein
VNASRTFLGLNAAAWTAILTAVLVVVTIIYVVLTGRLARHASSTADAAARSAESARNAAEASLRSADAAEAALPINFDAAYHAIPEVEQYWIEVVCLGATVFVHSAEVIFSMFETSDKQSHGETGPLRADEPLPARKHRGDTIHFAWPWGQVSTDSTPAATLVIGYGVRESAEPRHVECRVAFERPDS